MKRISNILALLTASSGLLSAATLRVPSEYPHIQRAVIAASDGDTILIEAGRHDLFLLEIARTITLQGEGTDQTTLVYKDKGYRYGIVITDSGTPESPVTIADLTIEGDGEHSKNWGQFIIGTADSTIELSNITLQNPITNFAEFVDSTVTIQQLSASQIQHRLIDTMVTYSSDISSVAAFAETIEMPQIYAKSPTRIQLMDSNISTDKALTEPIITVNQVASVEINRTQLKTNGPAAEVDNAFGRLVWPDAPANAARYNNGAVKDGPTKSALASEDPDQFRYLGGEEEDPLNADLLAKFYHLRRQQAESFGSAPITAVQISDILHSRSEFPESQDLNYFDSSWLRIELNFLNRTMDGKAIALMLLDEVQMPDGVSKSDYFGGIPVNSTDASTLGELMETEMAARLSRDLEGLITQQIKTIESQSLSIAESLQALDLFIKNDLGIDLTKTQMNTVRQLAANYVDRQILSSSTEVIRTAQDALRTNIYSFADRGELIPAQSLQARKALFETYQ